MNLMLRRRAMMSSGPKEQPNYLCFTALEDNSTIGKTGTYTSSLEFSVNGRTWNVFDNSTTINLNAGEKAYFRGNNTRLASSDSVCTTFVMTGSIAGSGNVMSLLYANDFDTRFSLTLGNEFRSLFINCTALTSSPELPATTLSGWSTYDKMFKGCTSLAAAPDLPASSLSRGCYTSMFEGCTGMLTAGTMSITSVAQDSLSSMFKGCSVLIDASNIEVNITSIGINAFAEMFYNCISLESPPSLRVVGAYANTAFSNMFYNCGIKSFPSFHITNLGSSEMQYMFYGCSSMEGDIDLSSCTSAYGTYQCREMFRNCSKITKVILPSITEVPASAYQDMFNGCSMLSYVMMLSISIANNWSLAGWLSNVASIGILVKHIDATWTGNVPSNWTVIYYDPALDKYYLDQQRNEECDKYGNNKAVEATTNPEAMAVIYAQGWSASPDYMTFSEASAVTDIGTYFRNAGMTHFMEFIHFTGVTTIKTNAFSGNNLTSLAIPPSVTTIERFGVYYSPLQYLYFPSSIVNYTASANFTNNSNVQFELHVDSLESYAVLDFGERMFMGDANNPDFYFYVGDNVLNSAVVLPNITKVGAYTFAGYNKISSITIPNSVLTIGEKAFFNARHGYTNFIDIGNGVTSIGKQAFADVRSCPTLICRAMTAPTLGTNVFQTWGYNIPTAERKLIVPVGAVGYDTDQWKTVLQDQRGYQLIYSDEL